jgi:valyl-tRNA synthetase
MDLPKRYDFKESEEKWKKYWEKNNIYKFNPKSKKKIYSIDTPPPTLSGNMHIGHAFSYAQEDFFARYQRMSGKNVFYPFGTDDNGLPTERLVEKLKKVKSTRMEREEFVKLCQNTIKELRLDFIQDWKDIGMSCDFNTTYSTIDDHSIRTSQMSFLDLYKKKLVYRNNSPTMWCITCQTAIAQAELEDKELDSSFNDVKFEVKGEKDLIIGTTRPELIPACVCVYVHPGDKRYKKYVGKTVKIPLSNREVSIFSDKSVDPEKGTGVLMICSYGDKYDVEAIISRKLTPRVIVNAWGKLNSLAEDYEGLTLKKARIKILEDLDSDKSLLNKKLIKHIVNVHDKCGTSIEFLSSEQWFIKVLNNKSKLIKAADKIKWYPKFMKKRYTNWVEGLQWDWGISRQRSYGVPFPVWYCSDCGKENIAEAKDLPVFPMTNSPKTKCSCGSKNFIPEKDVMDTWATSSVTPQITLDWIKDKKGVYKDVNFDKIYPMSLRPQAHDIIRTWAFYTIVKGIYHNNKVPWENIAISGFVLAPNKEKMSKSKGNVVDTRKIIKMYGADSMRYLASSSSLGKDFLYREEDIKNSIKEINKLWNASKFSLMHLEDFDVSKKIKLTDLDKGVLSKFNEMLKDSTNFFEEYEYSKSKSVTDNFFWNTFCDNYLEIVKDRLYNPNKRGEQERRSAQYVLYTMLNGILKLFAPIMPFITEEIYHLYFSDKEKIKSIHLSEWPKYNKKLKDEVSEKIFDSFIEILNEVRQKKAKNNKSLKEEIILTLPNKIKSLLLSSIGDLKAVTCAKDIKIGSKLKIEW